MQVVVVIFLLDVSLSLMSSCKDAMIVVIIVSSL